MKYVGRYQLEVGLIPISTLDVTLENDELWLKPSGIKKHRLQPKGRAVFIDEIAGTPCTFSKDENGKVVSLTFVYEGSDYTAQRVVLPAPSLKGNTTFKLKGYPEANLVVLAGTFNNWNQSQFVFGREGDEWVCRIDLEPGKHAYKFIVDGNWILDPGNAVTEEDAAGNVNSILVVAKDHTLPCEPTENNQTPSRRQNRKCGQEGAGDHTRTKPNQMLSAPSRFKAPIRSTQQHSRFCQNLPKMHVVDGHLACLNTAHHLSHMRILYFASD